MLLFAILLGITAGVVVWAFASRKLATTKFDRIGFLCNVVLAVIYIPMSVSSIFSLYAADTMFMFSENTQKHIDALMTVGVLMPLICVVSLALSVILRKKGAWVLSFVVQFVPLVLYLIMVIIFQSIYRF